MTDMPTKIARPAGLHGAGTQSMPQPGKPKLDMAEQITRMREHIASARTLLKRGDLAAKK